jgi:hypothetical protein
MVVKEFALALRRSIALLPGKYQEYDIIGARDYETCGISGILEEV